MFARLREWRKARAEAEAVPVYTIFTNDQLAEIVRLRCSTQAAWGKSTASARGGWTSTAGRCWNCLLAPFLPPLARTRERGWGRGRMRNGGACDAPNALNAAMAEDHGWFSGGRHFIMRRERI
ncbi:MAG: hypothetical protein BWK76_11595 [Desulfobulbaceae bacterium A2]|nr:MAG: hypothetical protein BWK76_11595 [Desulfobulbaceae bacterium A2]